MITAFIQFTLPPSTTRDAVMAAFRASVEQLRGYPGLIRKLLLCDAEEGTAAGVYLPESRSAAEALFADEWRTIITARYGSALVIAWFNTPILLDNTTDDVVSDAAD